MQQFLDANSGLISRIGYKISFPDYTVDELTKIYTDLLKKNQLIITDDALEKLKDVIRASARVENFGNGRYIHNIFQRILIEHSKNIETKKIDILRQGFLYNPDYFKDEIEDLNCLERYPLILQKKESNSRKFLDNYTLSNGIILNPKTEVVSQDLVLEFTNAGFGIGFNIIDLAKRNYPNLKELKINKKIPNNNIYLAKNKNINLPFASKKILEYLKFDNL